MRRRARSLAAGALVLAAATTVFVLGGRSPETSPEATSVTSAGQPSSTTGPEVSAASADSGPSAATADPDASAASADPDATAAASAPPATPSPIPVPAPTGTPDGEVGDQAADLVLPFIAAASAARADPDTPLQLEDVATGDAREDLALEAYEFAENGMVQSGAPTIVSATVMEVDESSDPPQTVVLVCLDYSDVDFRTREGESVKAGDAPVRVPTILTMQMIDQRWLVADRTFPDDSTC